MKLEATNLRGRSITLEPIGADHLDELLDAAQDASIWTWMTFALSDPAIAKLFVENVSRMAACGQGMGYAIRCNDSGEVIGGTGYWHIAPLHRKLEIGGSWLTPSRQGTGANTEAKYLLLCNAFDQLACKRVGFSIDTRNQRSIAAVKRIGASQEGVQRSDMTLHDGRDRDSAIFSIIRSEWPAVKAHLQSQLARTTTGAA